MNETVEQACRRLEHFETPAWAAVKILQKELLTSLVIDPCCGSGILTKVARQDGYNVIAFDIHDWGFPGTIITDWAALESVNQRMVENATVFMNPPFSLAEDFVAKALEYGARKIVCFQRFAWWESKKRRDFWQKNPPNRIYICGDRADCWRHDIPHDQRGSSTPTAHAWFVLERGNPSGTLLGHIYKGLPNG